VGYVERWYFIEMNTKEEMRQIYKLIILGFLAKKENKSCMTSADIEHLADEFDKYFENMIGQKIEKTLYDFVDYAFDSVMVADDYPVDEDFPDPHTVSGMMQAYFQGKAEEFINEELRY
jgi:hypothetical protein